MTPRRRSSIKGWLRTGDIGTAYPNGFIQITDRAKDVIKSGGEWISSVELESALMAHPEVVEATVIGVPDPRWTERPLACVVKRPRLAGHPRRAAHVLVDPSRAMVAARTLELHQRDPQDVGRQVRQEAVARAQAAGALHVSKRDEVMYGYEVCS